MRGSKKAALRPLRFIFRDDVSGVSDGVRDQALFPDGVGAEVPVL